ncbi:Alpha-maltose-1-phosphate synthase [Tepidimonas charontis]|uniref:Alpha-maltose-1-phosphate synthase n=2 Tax=Tepidimonas charontis TaxID=2267262 RepID=A0A554XK94_9BURK|nr:Alpha-maltose-1-phosphate synthase [Tepidimonas charontis]
MRILHFATAGFSGATQVAIDLCGDDAEQQTLLVLRRRPNTPRARIAELRARGLAVELVPRHPHWLTIWRLWRICRRWRPDILVAHGFSDHLWGRYAGLLAGVPHLVQVEHNVRERYGWWRLQQSRWLGRYTDALVGVSDAVRAALLRQGHPASRCLTIHNGIDLSRWPSGPPWEMRESAVVMAARFARQKDHETAIRAARLLVDRGTPLVFYFAGGGNRRWRVRAERLVEQLDVSRWVRFLGPTQELPALYGRVRYCLLSSHYEGLPLALVEGMASGCCALGSDVEGIGEVIADGHTGVLFAHADAQALADRLHDLVADPDRGRQLASAGQRHVRQAFGRQRMRDQYRALFRALIAGSDPRPAAAGATDHRDGA